MDNVIIREASTQDLPRILELWQGMMDYHADLDPIFTCAVDGAEKFQQFLQTILHDEEAFLLVADLEPNHTPVGYCLGKIDPYPPVFAHKFHGSIYDMMVATQHRRKHIGAELFIAAKNWFHQKGISRIELSVATKNEISPLFWEKMGFEDHMKKLAFTL